MTEMLMTEAATTNEGDASQAPNDVAATADALYGDKQQTDGAQDQQSQGEDTAGEKTGDEGADKTAPEKYEFKAPEGQEFDTEVIGAFSEVAKELGLSQEAAQKVVDKMAMKLAERQQGTIEAVRNEWADTARNDKEFGGEKLNENLAVAKKALDSFGTPELRALLNESGLGNNPEVIRFMFRAGKAISEDKYVGASQGAGSVKAAPKDFNGMASALYSNQQP